MRLVFRGFGLPENQDTQNHKRQKDQEQNDKEGSLEHAFDDEADRVILLHGFGFWFAAMKWILYCAILTSRLQIQGSALINVD